jgi:hypothetical protein
MSSLAASLSSLAASFSSLAACLTSYAAVHPHLLAPLVELTLHVMSRIVA